MVYLQCEGLEADSAQPRCPRDVALEREAWPKLRTLAECSTGSIGDGFVNVQLEFRDGQPEPQVQVFDWTGASRPGINPGVAHACLRHELRTLRTSLGAAKLVVSFRYGVLRGIAPAKR